MQAEDDDAEDADDAGNDSDAESKSEATEEAPETESEKHVGFSFLGLRSNFKIHVIFSDFHHFLCLPG